MAALAALLLATLFLGLAGYGVFVEAPARMALDPGSARLHWQVVQARAEPLLFLGALLAAIAGFWVGFRWDQWRWVVGAVLIFATWGFGLVGQRPIARALVATSETEIPTLLARWDRLQFVRLGLGGAALLIFLAGWRALSH